MTLAVGKKRPRNAPPIRRAPVPEMDWVTAIYWESDLGLVHRPSKNPEKWAHGTGFQRNAVVTIGQKSCVLCELWKTSDSKVFLVRVSRSNEGLSLG